MHSPPSIIFLLSMLFLLSAMPPRNLKPAGQPPIAFCTSGLLTPRFTPITTKASEGARSSVSRHRMQGGKTGAGLKRLRAREGVRSTRSQIVHGPRRDPTSCRPSRTMGVIRLLISPPRRTTKRVRKTDSRIQERACLALIEGPDVVSLVLLPASFPTPHACHSIDRSQSPRAPPWIIFS